MRKEKNKALYYRLQGRSYGEINNLLKIPKSTLSSWFSNVELSDRAKTRIQKRSREASLKGLLKRNKKQSHAARQRMLKIRSEAKKEVSFLTARELRLTGTILYWAEGYKRPIIRNNKEATYHPVALTNSDPRLISLFLRFLREICEVNDKDIKADIRIYKHMNQNKVLQFWENTTNLPAENFGKFYYGVSKSSIGKRPFNRLPYGTILIRVCNTNLFHKIMGWIEGISQFSKI